MAVAPRQFPNPAGFAQTRHIGRKVLIQLLQPGGFGTQPQHHLPEIHILDQAGDPETELGVAAGVFGFVLNGLEVLEAGLDALLQFRGR